MERCVVVVHNITSSPVSHLSIMMKLFVSLSVVGLAMASPLGLSAGPAPVCWRDTTTRGVGTVPESCTRPGYTDKSGALCYPVCKTDYYGVGPVCWEHCPSGWIDEGALCRESGSIKTIAKKSYGRGVGVVMDCGDKQEDAALCYPYCPKATNTTAAYEGVGPVCWRDCTAPDPVSGGAICCLDGTTCSTKIKDLASGIPLAVMKALLSGGNMTKIIEDAEQAIDAILGFVMPLCSTL